MTREPFRSTELFTNSLREWRQRFLQARQQGDAGSTPAPRPSRLVRVRPSAKPKRAEGLGPRAQPLALSGICFL